MRATGVTECRRRQNRGYIFAARILEPSRMSSFKALDLRCTKAPRAGRGMVKKMYFYCLQTCKIRWLALFFCGMPAAISKQDPPLVQSIVHIAVLYLFLVFAVKFSLYRVLHLFYTGTIKNRCANPRP